MKNLQFSTLYTRKKGVAAVAAASFLEKTEEKKQQRTTTSRKPLQHYSKQRDLNLKYLLITKRVQSLIDFFSIFKYILTKKIQTHIDKIFSDAQCTIFFFVKSTLHLCKKTVAYNGKKLS